MSVVMHIPEVGTDDAVFQDRNYEIRVPFSQMIRFEEGGYRCRTQESLHGNGELGDHAKAGHS
jgi:hypothetical protein